MQKSEIEIERESFLRNEECVKYEEAILKNKKFSAFVCSVESSLSDDLNVEELAKSPLIATFRWRKFNKLFQAFVRVRCPSSLSKMKALYPTLVWFPVEGVRKISVKEDEFSEFDCKFVSVPMSDIPRKRAADYRVENQAKKCALNYPRESNPPPCKIELIYDGEDFVVCSHDVLDKLGVKNYKIVDDVLVKV